MYNDVNLWLYAHINTAHEATGLHARTLDGDLVEFLDRVLRKYADTHDIVAFVMADHGMRYGD